MRRERKGGREVEERGEGGTKGGEREREREREREGGGGEEGVGVRV
jgi:hypothetical protein